MLIEVMIKDQLGVHHNFIPLNSLVQAIKVGNLTVVATQLIKNILLFIPLGLLIPLLFSRISFKKSIYIGFCSSLLIETTQLVLGKIIGYTYRSFDVDDLLMNTFGAAVGFIIYQMIYVRISNHALTTIK